MGETTQGWYLSSDVDPKSLKLDAKGGTNLHADWWGGWHPEINQQWIDNCVNFSTNKASGCGHGYLTDGGPNNEQPYAGPALKFRPQYTGPNKISAATLFAELCSSNRLLDNATEAAYCNP